jgi:hypothetical protein
MFAGFGEFSVPDTREGYRYWIESLDLSTEWGMTVYTTMMMLADSADDYYTQLEDETKDAYQALMDANNEKFAAEIANIEAVRDKLNSLTYSSYNLALPTAKMTEASSDYSAMFEAAQGGSQSAVSDYLAFVDTYLQSAQDTYKSSDAYLAIYESVLADIATLDTQPLTSIEDLTSYQTAIMEDQTRIAEEGVAAMQWMIDNWSTYGSTYLWGGAGTGGGTNTGGDIVAHVQGYASGGIAYGPTSGYSATLHGTEAVIPLASGSVPVTVSGDSDPEIKTLLQQLVAQGYNKQSVTLTLDNGKSFTGTIKALADEVRVSANERKGVETRRLYT